MCPYLFTCDSYAVNCSSSSEDEAPSRSFITSFPIPSSSLPVTAPSAVVSRSDSIDMDDISVAAVPSSSSNPHQHLSVPSLSTMHSFFPDMSVISAKDEAMRRADVDLEKYGNTYNTSSETFHGLLRSHSLYSCCTCSFFFIDCYYRSEHRTVPTSVLEESLPTSSYKSSHVKRDRRVRPAYKCFITQCVIGSVDDR